MTWADLAAVPWHQWVIMTFGTAGVVMTQIKATERYACWIGLLGQTGWAASLDWTPKQVGWCVVSIVCCAAWMWGAWRHWLSGWLDMAVTPTAAPSTGRWPPKPRARTTKLRRVK